MSMFGPKMVGWSIQSASDPRWNKKGRAYVGGLVVPEVAREALAQLKVELGEPPADLGWGYMKD